MNIHQLINMRAFVKKLLNSGYHFSITSKDGAIVYANMMPIFSSYVFENVADSVIGIPTRRIVARANGVNYVMLMLYRFEAKLVLRSLPE